MFHSLYWLLRSFPIRYGVPLALLAFAAYKHHVLDVIPIRMYVVGTVLLGVAMFGVGDD